jgi:hypothetical protein
MVLVVWSFVVAGVLARLGDAAGAAAAQPVSCGQVITQDTRLDADLTCDAGDGIVIGAPGITLDLGGHKVFADHFAIRHHRFDDVVVRNGSVSASDEPVHLTDSTT